MHEFDLFGSIARQARAAGSLEALATDVWTPRSDSRDPETSGSYQTGSLGGTVVAHRGWVSLRVEDRTSFCAR